MQIQLTNQSIIELTAALKYTCMVRCIEPLLAVYIECHFGFC